MKPLRLSVVQMNSRVGDTGGNLSKIRSFSRKAAEEGSDIVCFPEACVTGYTTDGPDRYAVRADGAEMKWISDMSRELGIAVVAGIMEAREPRPFIRQMLVLPDGRSMSYRKTHLGTKESEVFGRGDELPVIAAGKAVVGMHLCWETHMPEICTALRGKGAEIVLAPHSTGSGGENRKAIWSRILAARADDNGMYVAACNAVGDNGLGAVTGGGCAIFDPKGRVLAEYYGDGEKMVSAVLKGDLPRDDAEETMGRISYFDRRRPELYRF